MNASHTNKSRSISKTDTPLIQRKVSFNFEDTPLHWIPDNPYSSHFISVIHTVLPAGEFFFCRLYNKALPHIADEKLKEDVKGFIKQEAVHARAHSTGIDEFLKVQGMDTKSFTQAMAWLFEQALGDNPFGYKLPNFLQHRWLVLRLGLIAAIEHFTCVLGKYALENENWDQKGADETILDILRWHGAEEIEHRNVAFDVYQHLGGRSVNRLPQILLVAPAIIGIWVYGASHLMKQDDALMKHNPRLVGLYFWREWQRQAQEGQLPSPLWLLRQAFRYVKPGYNPLHEADTEQALFYLKQSPAARRAEALA